MLGLLSTISELAFAVTGDVVARTLSSVAYACGVALVNVAYVLLLWLLIASPKSVRYLETILLYLAARPFLTIALGILSYFVVIVVRGFLTAQLRVLQRWSLRSLKGPRRPGFKEALRRVLAHVFRLRAQAQLTKRAAGKKAGPGPSGAGKASARRGMRSFAVDVDPESPPSHFLANEPETSDLSLGGSEQTPREDRGPRRPRVSLQLAPLPRISIEFSPKKPPKTTSLRKKLASGWAPSMQRIPSGVELSQQGHLTGSPETSEVSTGTRMQDREPGVGTRFIARRLMNAHGHGHAHGGANGTDTSDTASEVDSLESVNLRLNSISSGRHLSLLGAAWRAYAPHRMQTWAQTVWGEGSGPQEVERLPNESNTSSRRPSVGAPDLPLVPTVAIPEPGTPEDLLPLLTEDHLLQYRAVMGDGGLTISLLQSKGFAPPFGPGPQSFFGPADASSERFDLIQSSDWERIIVESANTCEYTVWRRPMRNKFNMYRTRVLIRNARARDVRRFHLDDFLKPSWDDTMTDAVRLADCSTALGPVQREEAPEAGLANYVRRDSAFVYNRCKFPRPMKDREYVFARRVWDREDGGCFVLIKSCDHACYGTTVGEPKRTCPVTDYVSGMTIREDVAADGSHQVYIETLYFEDSRLNASFANMAVKKGLWAFVVKFEAAFRLFQGSVHQESPGRTPEDGSGAQTPRQAQGGDGREHDVDLSQLQSRMNRARKSKKRVLKKVFGWGRLVSTAVVIKLAQGIFSTL